MGMAKSTSWAKGKVLEQLVSGSETRAKFVLDKLMPDVLRLRLGPALFNTCCPTMIENSGKKSNQIPSECDVICNMRLIPGCSASEAMNDVREVLQKELVEAMRLEDVVEVSVHTAEDDLFCTLPGQGL